jgi:hypothetical protein
VTTGLYRGVLESFYMWPLNCRDSSINGITCGHWIMQRISWISLSVAPELCRGIHELFSMWLLNCRGDSMNVITCGHWIM